MTQMIKKVTKYLVILFGAIFINGCTSYPLKVCVSNKIDNFSISVCEDIYINRVNLYHYDSLSKKHITDYTFKLLEGNESNIQKITFGKVPEGFIIEKNLDSLIYNGEYFFDLNTSSQWGGLILQIEDGVIVDYKHDSTIDCCKIDS